jgi:hypothetical protein
MKNTKIHIPEDHRKSQGKIAIEWGIQELDQAECIEELRMIWDRLSKPMKASWQIELKKEIRKRKLLYAADNR